MLTFKVIINLVHLIAVRYKEYTESEFFAQFEKTLLHRWHVPKAQALRREFARFTELVRIKMHDIWHRLIC